MPAHARARATRTGRTAAIIAAASVVTLASAGVALATIPAADGTFTGCINNSTGALRVIDAEGGAACASGGRKGESTIRWNAVGPKGDPGQPGKDGINGTDGVDGVDGKDGKDGANGVSGYYREESDSSGTARPGTTGTVLIQCRSSYTAISAGLRVDAGGDQNFEVTSSYPGDLDSRWWVNWKYVGSASEVPFSLTGIAICVLAS